MPRAIKTTEYVRHTYTSEERLKMGDDLAGAHNRLAAIDDEEAVVKSKFKERKTTVEQTINSLSRDLSNGWTMQNCECLLRYGVPNPLEVSYFRIDTGELVKTRAMNQDELQEELPLTDREGEVAVIPPDKSAENVIEFFKRPEPEIMMEGLPEASEPEHAPSEEVRSPEMVIEHLVDSLATTSDTASGQSMTDHEVMLFKAASIFRHLGKPSVSALQRELRLSYKQAVALMDELKEAGEDKPEPEPASPEPETASPAAGDPWDEPTPIPTAASAPAVESGPASDLFTEEFVDEKGNQIPDPRKKSGPADLAKYHREQLEAEAKPKLLRKPKGFDKPLNDAQW